MNAKYSDMAEKSIQELADVLINIEDKELLQQFLCELLTPAEIEVVSLRWELLKLLSQGVAQREISRRLGISLCKITRGSRELKKETSALKTVLFRSGLSQSGEKDKEEVND